MSVDINVSITEDIVDIIATPTVNIVNVTNSASIDPGLYDLSEFTNTSGNPFVRTSGLSSYVPASRTLTINGTTQDLSANRTFTISTGLSVGTTPIASGTIGRVLFEGTGNVLQQSAGLTWDNTNNIFNSIGSVKATGVVSTTRSIEMLYDESIGSMIRTTNYDLIHLLSGSNKLATFQSTGILFPASSSQLIGNNSRNLVEVYNEGTGKLTAKTTGAWNLELGTNDSIRATIFGSTGNIGINTTTDAGFKLDVNGTARVQGNAQFGTGFYWDGTNERLGIGTTSPATALDVNGTIKANILRSDALNNSANTITLLQFSGTGNRLFDNSGTEVVNVRGGNVQIGTTTDAGFKLDVNGDALIRGHINQTGLGFQSVSIGPSASISVDSAYYVAIGNFAGSASSTGSYWTALGAISGKVNTTGNYWTSIGFQSGESNISGGHWTAIGAVSGNRNTSGSDWISIGFQSARFYSNGVDDATSFSNGVYIGTNTRVGIAGANNEIVIGYNAIGAGSNTVTLGNTSITKTILRGTINAAGLPTSSAGLSAGDIWNDGGTLKIV
jgi:hypothetical protein